jgi:PAS domain S-box-containing protein
VGKNRNRIEKRVQERTSQLEKLNMDQANANEALLAEIGKRQQAEATLRETEQKLRNIIEHSTNLFYMHGTDHVLTYVSPQSRHFFDCEPEEAIMFWTELITDNPLNRSAIEATQRAIDTGERQPSYMVECIGRKGRKIWVEVNESPIVEDGRTVAIVGSLTDITERKRAEEAQRESEQLFAFFMFHMPAAAWMKDMQGRYVYANAEAEHVFSTPLTALVGKTDKDIFPPEAARQFAENDCRVLAEGGSLQTTDVLRQADGTELHSIVSKFVVNGPDGKPAYIAGVALDITERKRMEAELEHLASFPRLNPTPIIEMDADGKVTFCNNAAEQILGKAECHDMSNHLIPKDLPDILRDLRQQKARQFTRTVEIDDLVLDVLIYLTPEFNSVRIYSVDITERRRAEQALRESEERLRLAIDSTSLGTFDFYPKTGELSWSELNKLHFGLPPEARADYQVFLAGVHPDDRERMEGIVRNLFRPESGGEYNAEYRTIGIQDGRERWIAARGRVYYDEAGQAVRFVGTTLDITERKRAEEEIKTLTMALNERALELAAANRELEAFNYTVAHDLRKPLTVVNSYCQTLKELCGSQLDAHCKEYLQEAYDGTLRMNLLIDALLNFSRLAHVELHRETVDLSGMAQVVAAELRLAELGRRVTFWIAEGISVNGDPNLLQVVLDNLLGNAWKYTATKEEAVIEFGMTEIEGKPACFVRDNGAGFNMADADKLFTPFQRLPSSEGFEGHGIGLATVERIISRHGGKIWAEGERGKGASFYFTLPL